MRRLMALLLLLLCVSPPVAWGDDPLLQASCDPIEGRWIAREGTNLIKIPHLAVSQGNNWSSSFDSIPCYIENQTISGAFQGENDSAGSWVEAAIFRFDISTFLSVFQSMDRRAKMEGNVSRQMLNSTADASFTLDGLPAGMYTVSVFDENSSAVLSSTPLFVTKADLTLQMPSNITAGDYAKLKVNLSLAEGRSAYPSNNESRIFAAIMISRQDYENASLHIASNGTEGSLNSTLSLKDKSMQMQGLPAISSDLLMKVLYLLPMNSAVGMQEAKANESVTEILLITDREWEKGSYILTCGVYSPGSGLLGLKQMAVEVI
jgi:methanogen extracellular protein (TIGR04279 family)